MPGLSYSSSAKGHRLCSDSKSHQRRCCHVKFEVNTHGTQRASTKRAGETRISRIAINLLIKNSCLFLIRVDLCLHHQSKSGRGRIGLVLSLSSTKMLQRAGSSISLGKRQNSTWPSPQPTLCLRRPL